MPPVILTGSVVDLSKIKMKWKETYVSEGLNRKVIPAMPKGIYSGLKLIQNISSPRRVEVSAGTDLVHAAVYQSAAGFSTTYHDNAGVSTILDLSSASLDNQETVITLQIVYIIGADTTANWIAYPIADWNALTVGQQSELIVLGTVNVPAPATNITTAMILPKRRTDAWTSIAPGVQSWDPVVKNTSFNASYVSGNYEKWQIPDWDPLTTGGTGGWLFGAGRTGGSFQGLKLDPLTGPYTGQIYQHIGLPVSQTQRIRYRFFKKVTTLAATGTLEFVIQVNTGFGVGPDTEFTVSIPANAVDVSFVEFSDTILLSQIMTPPADAQCTLKSIGFRATTLSATAVVVFDDVQVWVERVGDQLDSTYGRDTRLYNQTQASPLIVRDRSVGFNSVYPPAAVLDYQATDGEGALWLHHPSFYKQDGTQDPTWVNPAFRVYGRMMLGEGLIDSESHALFPRVEARVSTVGGVDFTLMWRSVPSGQPGYRKYVSPTGTFVETINASWNGTGWAKDVGGLAAVKRSIGTLEHRVDLRLAVNNSSWGDGSWDTTSFDQTWGGATQFVTSSMNLFSDLWLANGANITLNGTGDIKHGDRVTVHPAMLLNTGGTSWSSTASGAQGVNNALAATILLSGFRVGDRIKSIEPRVLGDGVTNFQYGLRKLENGGGNVQANATYTPPASWGFAPAQVITSPTIIAAGQSYCVIVGLLAASGSITISTINVTHDHP